MRKWVVWAGVAVVGLGLLGYWLLFHVLVVRAPRGGVIHIETPGGPVPLGVTIFEKDRGVIRVGHGYDGYFEPICGGRNLDFQITEFSWSKPDFEIVFPRTQTTLVMHSNAGVDDGIRADGTLIVREGDRIVEEIAVTMPSVYTRCWFDSADQALEDDGSRADFSGTWQLEIPGASRRATIFIPFIPGWRTRMDNEIAIATHAELLTHSTEHRNFSGNITGNRIRLASFDNAYPALIDAVIQDDGRLKGDLWVGDRLHESFVGTRE